MLSALSVIRLTDQHAHESINAHCLRAETRRDTSRPRSMNTQPESELERAAKRARLPLVEEVRLHYSQLRFHLALDDETQYFCEVAKCDCASGECRRGIDGWHKGFAKFLKKQASRQRAGKS